MSITHWKQWYISLTWCFSTLTMHVTFSWVLWFTRAVHYSYQCPDLLDGRVITIMEGIYANLYPPFPSTWPWANLSQSELTLQAAVTRRYIKRLSRPKYLTTRTLPPSISLVILSKKERKAIRVSFLAHSFLINMPGPFTAHNSQLSKHLHISPA